MEDTAQMANQKSPIKLHGPSLFEKPAELKRLGGSESDFWNSQIANQAVNTLYSPTLDSGEASETTKAVIVGLAGINPRDEIEGMIAAQMIAGHNASMDCYRRAARPEIELNRRDEYLAQASKLSRTFAALVEALNRHRGKGQQKVTVEHVHVHKGGQAIVGNVESPRGGVRQDLEEQPHAKRTKNASVPEVRSTDAKQPQLQISSDAKRAMPAARGIVARRSKGK